MNANLMTKKIEMSKSEAKEAGKLRIEGKECPVQDGDVIHVRFSV